MNLYQLKTPMQWVAGYVGKEKKPIFFDCGYCDAKEPVIHAFIGPTPTEVGVLNQPGTVFIRKAILCESCLEKANGAFFPPCKNL
jgi:hypothetical protein